VAETHNGQTGPAEGELLHLSRGAGSCWSCGERAVPAGARVAGARGLASGCALRAASPVQAIGAVRAVAWFPLRWWQGPEGSPRAPAEALWVLLLPGASVLPAGLDKWTRGVDSPQSVVSVSLLLAVLDPAWVPEWGVGSVPGRQLAWRAVRGCCEGAGRSPAAGLGWSSFPSTRVSHQARGLAHRLELWLWGRGIQLQRVPSGVSPSCLALSQPRLGRLFQLGLSLRPGDEVGWDGESVLVKKSGWPAARVRPLRAQPPGHLHHLGQAMFSDGSLLSRSFGQTPSGLSTWGPVSLLLPLARPPAPRCLVCGLCGHRYLLSPSVTSPLGGESPGHTSSPLLPVPFWRAEQRWRRCLQLGWHICTRRVSLVTALSDLCPGCVKQVSFIILELGRRGTNVCPPSVPVHYTHWSITGGAEQGRAFWLLPSCGVKVVWGAISVPLKPFYPLSWAALHCVCPCWQGVCRRFVLVVPFPGGQRPCWWAQNHGITEW